MVVDDKTNNNLPLFIRPIWQKHLFLPSVPGCISAGAHGVGNPLPFVHDGLHLHPVTLVAALAAVFFRTSHTARPGQADALPQRGRSVSNQRARSQSMCGGAAFLSQSGS